MPENQHEVSQVMEYWQKKGAWVAKRRQFSWGGANKHANIKPKDFRIACGSAIGICVITWEGKVLNCQSDADGAVVWGDLNTESIKDIWKRRNEEMVKFHFSHEFDKLPPICRNCNDWQIIGEERFDELGNPVNKNYNASGKVFDDKK